MKGRRYVCDLHMEAQPRCYKTFANSLIFLKRALTSSKTRTTTSDTILLHQPHYSPSIGSTAHIEDVRCSGQNRADHPLHRAPHCEQKTARLVRPSYDYGRRGHDHQRPVCRSCKLLSAVDLKANTPSSGGNTALSHVKLAAVGGLPTYDDKKLLLDVLLAAETRRFKWNTRAAAVGRTNATSDIRHCRYVSFTNPRLLVIYY